MRYFFKKKGACFDVICVSRYDVLLSLHIADLKDRMLTAHLHKPVTFAAEKTCWPDAALCKWLTASPYLNAGVFAGEKQHVLGMLEDMVHRLGEFAFCGDDQRAYQRCTARLLSRYLPQKTQKDVFASALFFKALLLPWSDSHPQDYFSLGVLTNCFIGTR